MSDKKITWNDLHEATQHELKKTYKLNDRQLENQIRMHWDGSNQQDKRKLYETVYLKRR